MVPYMDKRDAGAEHGKTSKWCQVWENRRVATSVHKRDTAVKARKNVQAVPSAGKRASGAKRGKTCKRCQARENVQAVPSAGKRASGAKRGKTCKRCQARENVQAVPSAGKRASGAKRGKTCKRCQARENVQAVLSAGKYGYMYAKSCEFGVFHFSECVFTCALKRDAQVVFCKGFYFFFGISHSPRTPLGHAHR